MAARDDAARRVLRSVVAPALRVSLPALLAGALTGCARGADAESRPAITSEPPAPPTVSAGPTTTSAAPEPSASAPQPASDDTRVAVDAGPPEAVHVPRTYPKPGPARRPPPGPPNRNFRPGPPASNPFSNGPGLAPQAAALALAREPAEPRPTRGTRRRTDPDRARLLQRRRVA